MGFFTVLSMLLTLLDVLLRLFANTKRRGELSQANQDRLALAATKMHLALAETTRLGIAPATMEANAEHAKTFEEQQ